MLDDNRLYRQTPPPPPPAPAPAPKKNSKKARAALRASKRRKVSEPEVSDEEAAAEPVPGEKEEVIAEYDGLGGMKWECLAITLDDLNHFLASMEKTRDAEEKALRARIIEDLVPILEKQEEARKRKLAQKERELLNLEKLATAKRSSRIAGKLEQQRQEEEAREAERKRQAELAMAKKEQEKWMRLEKERESRMMTREQRLKEREARRILHEEELAGLSEDSKKLEAGESRLSERHLKAEIEKKKQALEELAEEDDWVFDCICGAYGQVDDGSHSISCEKCNVWQHTKCVGISEAAANRDDFHFICKTCKRRAEEEEKAKHRPTIKLKFNRPGSSSSPVLSPQLNGLPAKASPHLSNGPQSPNISSQKINSTVVSPPRPQYESPYSHSWKRSLKPHSPNSNGVNPTPTSPPPKADGRPVSQGLPTSANWSTGYNNSSPRPNFQAGPYPNAYPNGGHAFSSPHPYSPTSLPPPPQHRDYTFINGQTPAGISGTTASQSVLQPNVNSHMQSYPHPAATPRATPDNRYAGQPLPSPHTGLVEQVQNDSKKVPFAHIGTEVPPSKTGMDERTGAEPPNSLLPLEQTQNGQQTPHANQSQQKGSRAVPSPLAANNMPTEPTLNGQNGMAYSSLPKNSTASGQQPVKSPSAQLKSLFSPPCVQTQDPYFHSGSSHVSALPPAITGISPTKHSPPRPTTTNGIATPSVLPPVAPLSPSPQQPNFKTPPVKSSEPEKPRLPGSFPQPNTVNGTTSFDQVVPSVLPSVAVSEPERLQQTDNTLPVETTELDKRNPSSEPVPQ